MRTSILNLTGLEWNEANLPKIVELLRAYTDPAEAQRLAWDAPTPQIHEELPDFEETPDLPPTPPQKPEFALTGDIPEPPNAQTHPYA